MTSSSGDDGPRDPGRLPATGELNRTVLGVLALARRDLHNCIHNARRDGINLGTLVFVVGAPRLVAKLVPRVEVCDCAATAYGIDRAGFVAGWRAMGRHQLADDLDAPLGPDQVRVLVAAPESVSAATITDPTRGGRA